MSVKVTNLLPQFTESVKFKAARGMTQALIIGSSEASVLTPIDTSTLLNSQFKRVDTDGDQVTGTVGYTAAYAAAVHDPSNPQNFRRASAEKEFLKKGFENAEPNIRAVLKGAIRA
jgi:hypothetical protein